MKTRNSFEDKRQPAAIALAARFAPLRYARALVLAVVLTIFANALRAASLFYFENGFVPQLSRLVGHEVVGIAAFVMVAASLAKIVMPKGRRVFG